MSARDMLRPGVLLHVVAQSALQRRYSGSGRDVRGTLAEAGFDKALILRNVERLARLVAGLAPPATAPSGPTMTARIPTTPPSSRGRSTSSAPPPATRRWRLAWDLGCNTGTFSRVVAEHADNVVAMDGDWMAIERLYQREKAAGGRARPAARGNLADASPNQGWLGAERKGLAERGRPELTLCLALVHHIVIGANIPLAEFIGWLAGLGTRSSSSASAARTRWCRPCWPTARTSTTTTSPRPSATLLAARFDIRADEPLKGGKRHIYFAEARA